MSEQATIGLDNNVFRGRLRRPERMKLFNDSESTTERTHRRSTIRPSRVVNLPPQQSQHAPQAIAVAAVPPILTPMTKPLPPVQKKVYYRPKTSEPQTDTFALEHQPAFTQNMAGAAITNNGPYAQTRSHRRYIPHPSFHISRHPLHALSQKILSLSKLQYGLVGMAIVVFVVGMFVSFQTVKTNHAATAAIASLSKQPSNGGNNATVPSIAKPPANALANYTVAPDLPRYIKIPRLGVDARVLQTGLTSSGALGTPDNIYDTAWYTGSALPGQPGATLIDGHISSWTSRGVFYGLNTLSSGDTIQVITGNGTVYNYQVVSSQVYNASDVDMQSAITPVTPGGSGLNLISCTGNVIKGTSLYDERIIVYAKLELSVGG